MLELFQLRSNETRNIYTERKRNYEKMIDNVIKNHVVHPRIGKDYKTVQKHANIDHAKNHEKYDE